ncbi:hypothetical protein DFH07DRAFT_470143 [Mycena maculata]|uniref:Uncharacterized protein n=1 Tax=Mycena maculata TaxID=230809 RepID=A0AAD7K8C1_9AGAR|nr:hypothetical protein DFH07DRAFT_470143 [Mycena maculata]
MTVTHTHTTSATVAAVLASSSSSPSALSSTSSALVAPVIGGVAGGIVGLAALIFLVTFCIRRRSRKDMDEVNFDPGSFRRSAMLITDPPTHQDTVARGYNPPAPPPMMERRQMYPGSNHDGPNGDRSPTSGNPLIFQAPFSPITPVATSPVSAYDHSWPAPSPAAPVPVLTRTTPAKSATSNASSAPSPHDSAQYAQYPALPGPRNTLAVPQPENDYLDLERTSVTPFQAAQYVEISKRLNTDVPKGLETPEVEEFVATQIPIKDADLPPIPPNDPFTDDAAPNDEDEDEDETVTLPMVQELSFPAPPSPAHSTSSRHRVDSMPPTLPEIVVQSRVSVTSAYLSDAGSPFAPGFPSGQTVVMKGQESPMGNRFPVTPSPLASSFVVPSPPAATTTFPAAPAAVQPRPDAQGRQSVYTLYDPEDAYGGI